MRDHVDNIVGSEIEARPTPALVVGVIHGDRTSVFGYGRVRDARQEPPSGETLFEIGSVTKVFTSALLAILMDEGAVSLGDAVRDLAPELSNLPAEITLLRLATHTAGLPKMPSNVIWSMLRNRRNPYLAYTAGDMLAFLSRFRPRRKAPAPIVYSNLGMALLGLILSQKVGASYEQAIVSRICDPLDLADTRITLNAEQTKRMAVPHKANGRPGHSWELPAFAGAGALRSTASDLLAFLKAHLGTPQSAITEALQACHEIRSQAFPPPTGLQKLVARKLVTALDPKDYEEGIGLGWLAGRLRNGNQRVHWHHGATGGYRAFVGFVKATGTGAVVLSGSGPGGSDLLLSTTSTDVIGLKVLEALNASA